MAAADVAHLVGHLVGHLDERALEGLLGALQLCGKVAVEPAQHAAPVDLALLDLVELLFHRGGKAQIDDVREALEHEIVDHVAQNGGAQILALLDDILAAEDGGDGRGVGRRAADALFLHGADERGLGVARGRLGKVLGALELFQVDGLTLVQVGQRSAALLLFLVLPLLIHGGVAGKAQLAAVGAEEIAGALGVDDDVVVYGVCHLRGGEAPPDQAVQAVLLGGEILFHALGRQRHHARPDGLVRVLRGGVGFIAAGRAGVIRLAVAAADEGGGVGQRVLRQAQRVGSHVGDEADGALALDVDALIELLRHGHGLARGHAKPA